MYIFKRKKHISQHQLRLVQHLALFVLTASNIKSCKQVLVYL
jgi:hypothetical protein